MIPYILFIVGFFLLILGANALVDGASAIGKKLNIPSIVLGLTVVALGTSLPEMIISVMASLKGATDLSISNVLGSNILNVFVILGVSAIIYPVTAKRNTHYKEIPFSFIAAILLWILVNDQLLFGAKKSELSTFDGLFFLGTFIGFLFYTYHITKNSEEDESLNEIQEMPVKKAILYLIGGIGGLFIGGNWVVNGVEDVGRLLGLSESVIGLTIVAFATSLPELVTSAVAAFKKNSDIAIGNVIGSNIFNICLVLGVSSTVHPLPFYKSLNTDASMVVISNIFLFLFLFIGKGRKISRLEGFLFVLVYLSFLTWSLYTH